MDLTFIIKGILIGFAMAVPLGPIGIICIRKTLTEGRIRGLVIGMGAATADMFYAAIAAFGLTVISDTLNEHRIWIRLIGGALLLFLGIRTFLAKPKDPKLQINGSSALRSYLTTIFLTLTNPFTIFAFIAVFATLGLGNGLSYLSATILIVGVFIGSLLWFVILSSGVTFFRKKLDMTGLRWVNKIAGILIIISGIIAIVSLI
jgi:threonine/homoserine/homoserine lactone efflux protein